MHKGMQGGFFACGYTQPAVVYNRMQKKTSAPLL